MMENETRLTMPDTAAGKKERRSGSIVTRELHHFWKNRELFLLSLPGIVYKLIFAYLPMIGLVIAFKNYRYDKGIFGSDWAGLKNFKYLFTGDAAWRITRNTVLYNAGYIILTTCVALLFAILLNELKAKYTKFYQTSLFLPHFLSWVIVAGVVLTLFSIDGGTINKLLGHWGMEPIPFLYRANSWIAIFIGSGMWKEMGFGAIIYLAALAGIDPSLYESAGMDGAGKLRQIWHITLPGIRSTIILLLILGMGRLMEVGFDQVYNLQNPTVLEKAEVISTYVYKVGLQQAQFGLTTAMGLFESFVGLVLVLSANALARKFDQGLF